MPEPKATAVVGQVEKSELEELRKKAAELETLKKESSANGEAAKELEKVKAELAKREAADKLAKRESFKANLKVEGAKEIARLNENKFSGKLLPSTLEAVLVGAVASLSDEAMDKQYIPDSVDGFDKAILAVKESAYKLMREKAAELEAYEARQRKDNMNYSVAPNPQFNAPNFNIPDKDRTTVGIAAEQTYFNDENRQRSGHDAATQLKLSILSKALKKPMLKPGTRNETWLQEHTETTDAAVKEQQKYARNDGIADADLLAHGGKVFHALSEQQSNLERAFFKAEANENTSSSVIGSSNLAIDFSALVVQAAWPRLLAKRIAAKTGIMTSATKRLYELAIPRSWADPMDKDRHYFGAVDSDTPTTLDTSKTLADGTVVADGGALSAVTNGVPQEVWAYLGEVVDADTTITLTVTLPSQASSTATVSFLTTDAVGTIKKCTAAGLFGDVYTDVTAVSSTGWTDAAAKGEVAFFAKKPMAEITAGSAAAKSGFSIATTSVSATSYNKQSSLTLELIEDLRMSLNDDGLDGIATILRLLAADVQNIIDKQLFYSMISNTYSGNQTTLAANTPSAGYSDLEWKARLHFYQNDMMSRVLYNSGQKPNNIVWSEWDWASYNEWLTQSNVIHRLHVDANDPFADGKAKFQISGADVYVSENVPPEYIPMAGNQMYGVHSYDYVPLRLMVADNPAAGFQKEVLVRTRGYHGVPDDDKVVGGQSIGLVKVTRR